MMKACIQWDEEMQAHRERHGAAFFCPIEDAHLDDATESRLITSADLMLQGLAERTGYRIRGPASDSEAKRMYRRLVRGTNEQLRKNLEN